MAYLTSSVDCHTTSSAGSGIGMIDGMGVLKISEASVKISYASIIDPINKYRTASVIITIYGGRERYSRY